MPHIRLHELSDPPVRKPNMNQERDDAIFIAHQSGANLQQIAQRYGLHKSRVQQILVRRHSTEKAYKKAWDAYAECLEDARLLATM